MRCIAALLCASVALLALSACGGAGEPRRNVIAPPVTASALAGEWRLVEIAGRPALLSSELADQPHAPATISFQASTDGPEGRLAVNGYSGCNFFGVAAVLAVDELVGAPVSQDMAGCGSDALTAQETALFRILASRSRVSITPGGDLTLTAPNGEALTGRRPPVN